MDFVFVGVPATNKSYVTKMIDLNDIYNTGTAKIPPPGRYSVSLRIGFWLIILEKSININNKGQNHFPVFFLRKFNVPLMSFKIYLDIKNKEVVFEYDNGKLIDRLKKRKDKNEFIGKICYRGKLKELYLGYFILRRK